MGQCEVMLYRDLLEYDTKPNQKLDITKDIQSTIEKSGIKEGLCNVFLKSTTSALILNEDDRMLMADIEKMLNQIAPADKLYQHPENAPSHLKALLTNKDVDVPIADGRLLLGTWQSIMLWEFDIEPRRRTIVVTIIG